VTVVLRCISRMLPPQSVYSKANLRETGQSEESELVRGGGVLGCEGGFGRAGRTGSGDPSDSPKSSSSDPSDSPTSGSGFCLITSLSFAASVGVILSRETHQSTAASRPAAQPANHLL